MERVVLLARCRRSSANGHRGDPGGRTPPPECRSARRRATAGRDARAFASLRNAPHSGPLFSWDRCCPGTAVRRGAAFTEERCSHRGDASSGGSVPAAPSGFTTAHCSPIAGGILLGKTVICLGFRAIFRVGERPARNPGSRRQIPASDPGVGCRRRMRYCRPAHPGGVLPGRSLPGGVLPGRRAAVGLVRLQPAVDHRCEVHRVVDVLLGGELHVTRVLAGS